jgi:hypothetical protein
VADWPPNGFPIDDPRAWTPVLEPKDFANLIRAYPKQSRLKNKAILADIIISPANVARRHVTGINVLYGDASVRYVPLKSFVTSGVWRFIPPGEVSTTWNDEMLHWNPDGGLWWVLDKQ